MPLLLMFVSSGPCPRSHCSLILPLLLIPTLSLLSGCCCCCSPLFILVSHLSFPITLLPVSTLQAVAHGCGWGCFDIGHCPCPCRPLVLLLSSLCPFSFPCSSP
ncbi:hypothetical protein L208DRAFT_430089 [Tricholoma matsutake]|nr:hypothetical protein L208DRAFT_430089 [Tricholoma matsutake 945]